MREGGGDYDRWMKGMGVRYVEFFFSSPRVKYMI